MLLSQQNRSKGQKLVQDFKFHRKERPHGKNCDNWCHLNASLCPQRLLGITSNQCVSIPIHNQQDATLHRLFMPGNFSICKGVTNSRCYRYSCGVRGSAVGWGTALQDGRSRFRFTMVSLEFFIDIIFPAALWPWGWLRPLQKWVPGIFPGGFTKAAGG